MFDFDRWIFFLKFYKTLQANMQDHGRHLLLMKPDSMFFQVSQQVFEKVVWGHFLAWAKLKLLVLSLNKAQTCEKYPGACFEPELFPNKNEKLQAQAYIEPFFKSGLLSLEPGAYLLRAKNWARAFEPKPRLVPPLGTWEQKRIGRCLNQGKHLSVKRQPSSLLGSCSSYSMRFQHGDVRIRIDR